MAENTSETMIAHVNMWMDSGISMKDYASKIGVTKGKFWYWVNKVKSTKTPTSQNPQFIDLASITDSLKCVDNISQKKGISNPQMELVFPSGVILKIYS